MPPIGDLETLTLLIMLFGLLALWLWQMLLGLGNPSTVAWLTRLRTSQTHS